MSLAVMINATASWARRCLGWRPVLRRSCPKFDSHELARSTLQRIPKRNRFGLAAGAAPWAHLGAHDIVDAVAGTCLQHRGAVVAAVEVKGLDASARRAEAFFGADLLDA